MIYLVDNSGTGRRKYGDIPMVRDAANRLFTFISDQLDLVLDLQHNSTILHACCVPNQALHGSRIPLLAIFAQVSKLNSFSTVSIHRPGSFEVLLTPSLGATMQRIRVVAIIDGKLITLAIEVLKIGSLHPVGRPSNGFAEVGIVVGLVALGVWKALNDVLPSYSKLLDQSSLGEEGERGVWICGGHVRLGGGVDSIRVGVTWQEQQLQRLLLTSASQGDGTRRTRVVNRYHGAGNNRMGFWY